MEQLADLKQWLLGDYVVLGEKFKMQHSCLQEVICTGNIKHDSLWTKHIALCATRTPTMKEGEHRQGALLTYHISYGSLLTSAKRTMNTNRGSLCTPPMEHY